MLPFLILNHFDLLIHDDMELYYFWEAHFKLKFPLMQFLRDPRHVHLIAAKHIQMYLEGTVDYGIKYKVDQRINLEGYADSNWAGSAINRKSTSGCCFSMGSGVIWHGLAGSYPVWH